MADPGDVRCDGEDGMNTQREKHFTKRHPKKF